MPSFFIIAYLLGHCVDVGRCLGWFADRSTDPHDESAERQGTGYQVAPILVNSWLTITSSQEEM
jgi:hypothetical protein